MKVKTIIFDLDGVIVHTDKFHYLAWEKICEEEGLLFDESINHQLRGVSRRESLDLILKYNQKELKDIKKDELLEKKNNLYKESLNHLTKNDLSNDILDTLLELKKRGYLIAIGSSSKNTKFILEKLEIINLFDAISDGTNISRSKPDPEVFLYISNILNQSNETCLVVEDANAGIEAAKRVKMIAVGIGDSVSEEIADYKIKNISNIIQLLELINNN
ncbi:beta-phosphoglucomutase [Acholeplasma hippikon]|uniref:Beta-phosphoglucomutase n=1 Tax=Acholeplasma hippikon TaxID=264636 RepID=A0A449BJ34_9MOLU|nr:beta-phosphoglucomutase [Acholeplasma hippikon]VEU82448.1 Putative beta-phosphoglucomutase [Acholeplasma hippikon]